MYSGFSIDPNAIYGEGDLVLGLGITQAALLKARRAGQLRFIRKGKRVLFRGQWLLDWVDGNTCRPAGGCADG